MSTRRYDVLGQVEHYDRDFQMDSAFYNRTGFTSGGASAATASTRATSRFAFIKRVVPFVFTQGGQDRVQPDRIPRRAGYPPPHGAAGLLPCRLSRRPRAVAVGQRFKRGRWRAFGNAQFFRWLRGGGNVNSGYATYYDEVDPFQGRSRNLSGVRDLSSRMHGCPSRSSGTHVDFNRADTGADVYDLVIVNSRTTYQFSRRLFARLIAQYDTSERPAAAGRARFVRAASGHRVLRRLWRAAPAPRPSGTASGRPTPTGPLRESRRGLFLKASYLYRFLSLLAASC